MRKRIFEIIEVAREDDRASKYYDLMMLFVILLSFIPLMVKKDNLFFEIIDLLAAFVFIVDYILRFMTADYKIGKGVQSFFIYPFTFMALIDFLCILPSFVYISESLKVLRVLRVFVAFRAFKIFRYSRPLRMVLNVVKAQKKPLITVVNLAVAYIVVAALIIFNVEPDTFDTFFDALYWATISLATIGYGDIAPVTVAGRLVTMISTLVGMAVIALPSGIITAGYLKELDENHDPNHALDDINQYML